MSSNLENQYVDDTFDGLLHMNGDPIPASGKGVVYDGSGQASALSVGLSGNGVGVKGSLEVGTLTYPSTNAPIGAILYQKTATEIDRIEKLPSSSIADVEYSIDDDIYIHPRRVALKKSGLVSRIFTPYNPTTSNYEIASDMFVRKDGSISIGTASIKTGGWDLFKLDGVTTLGERGTGNTPRIAIVSINVTNADNYFETSSNQRATFFVSPTNDVSSTSYRELTPVMSFYAPTGRSISAGAQFIVPVSGSNARFYMTTDNDPTSPRSGETSAYWNVSVRLIAFVE